MSYAFGIAYRDEHTMGDIKQVWGLSRLQNLAVLTSTFALTRHDRRGWRVADHLKSWRAANPPLSGLYWVSGIELGMRLLSSVWVRRLLDGGPGARGLFENNPDAQHQLCQHQRRLAAARPCFSASTHTVADAAVQLTAVCAFPWFTESSRWLKDARRLPDNRPRRHIVPSGFNVELATEYYGLVLELDPATAVEADVSGHRVPGPTFLVLLHVCNALAPIVDVEGQPPCQGTADHGNALVVAGSDVVRWLSLLATWKVLFGRLTWWPRPDDQEVRIPLQTALTRPRAFTAPRPFRQPAHFDVADHQLAGAKQPLPVEPFSDKIWVQVLEDAGAGRLIERLWPHVQEDAFPATARQARPHYPSALFWALQLEKELVELVNLLRSAAIENRIEGSVIAQRGHLNLSQRSFIDLNVLVRADDFDRTVCVLADTGFVRLSAQPDAGLDRPARIKKLIPVVRGVCVLAANLRFLRRPVKGWGAEHGGKRLPIPGGSSPTRRTSDRSCRARDGFEIQFFGRPECEKGGDMADVIPLARNSRVYVAGHMGLAGSGIWRALKSAGFKDLVGLGSGELDLRDRNAAFAYLRSVRPEVVVLAAARVGGIIANDRYPADFLSENLQIQVNVMDAAHAAGVERLLFLGSSCAYPKFADQPINESSLLTGELEPTNDAYAVAKIAGLTQVAAARRQYGVRWISAMPTNLYGIKDNFDPENSHVLPAMIRRFHDAVEHGRDKVTLWGSGTPRREFLHVDDLGRAILRLLDVYDEAAPINVGVGEDLTIRELAEIVADVVGFKGDILQDTSRPDGTPRKLLNVSRIKALGWSPTVPLREGIESTYRWFLEHQTEAGFRN